MILAYMVMPLAQVGCCSVHAVGERTADTVYGRHRQVQPASRCSLVLVVVMLHFCPRAVAGAPEIAGKPRWQAPPLITYA